MLQVFYFNLFQHVAITSTTLSKALFSSRKISGFAIVALSALFDNYYSIIDLLGSKDSSHKLQINCVISYIFLSLFNVSCMCRKI